MDGSKKRQKKIAFQVIFESDQNFFSWLDLDIVWTTLHDCFSF